MKKTVALIIISILFLNLSSYSQNIAHGQIPTVQIRDSLKSIMAKSSPTDKVSVIVRFKDRPRLEKINELKTHGLVKRELNLINGLSLDLTIDELGKLALDGSLLSLELDEKMKLTLDNSTKQIGAPAVVKTMGITGQGVRVAILDTGIMADHPALKGSVVLQKDFTGEGDGDKNGHGTHVANIISGDGSQYPGTAPGADLLIAKVMDKDGNGDMSLAISALDWALQNKAQVANISLGALIPDCDGTDALAAAVDQAVSQGLTVVVAAGNNGPLAHTINTPGCSKTAITVGAVNDFNDVVYFSSRGPTADGRVKPDILAPGYQITSAWIDGEFKAVSGTSQATPHIVGVVALLKQAKPDLTPDALKNLLIKTSTPLDQRYVNTQNQGIVNAAAAINEIGVTKITPPDNNDVPSNPPDTNNPPDQSNNNQPSNTDTTPVNQPDASSSTEPTAATPQEAREEFKNCLKSAGSNADKKEDCLNEFLNNQRRFQYQKLSSLEQSSTDTLVADTADLEKTLQTVSLAPSEKDQIMTLTSLIKPFLFISAWPQTVSQSVKNLTISLKQNTNIDQSINALKSIVANATTASLQEKYNRQLNPFIDADASQWFLSYVDDIKQRGCVSGYKDSNGKDTGYYGSGNTLTVAESLRIILECSGANTTTVSSNAEPKTIKARDHWARQYYVLAESMGLSITGNSAADPNRPITRAEFIKETLETFSIAPATTFTAIFTDVPASHPDAPWIYKAYELEIIAGDSSQNTFRPTGLLNRAEAARVVLESLTVK